MTLAFRAGNTELADLAKGSFEYSIIHNPLILFCYSCVAVALEQQLPNADVRAGGGGGGYQCVSIITDFHPTHYTHYDYVVLDNVGH